MTKTGHAVFAVYAAGLLQGFAFVLIPALGDLLEGPLYGLSHSAYGALFLPQIAGAIGSALAAGALKARMGGHGLFRLGLACNVLAAALLAGSKRSVRGGCGPGWWQAASPPCSLSRSCLRAKRAGKRRPWGRRQFFLW